MEIPRHHVETTIALGAAGQLTATRLQESTTELFTQSLSPSIGLFFTFRQSFKPWLGYSVNFGYTRAMFRQTSSPPLSTGGRTYESYVPNHLYETSVSYIAQRHLTKRVTVFGEAGAGAVTFSLNNHEFRYSPDPAVYIGRSDTYRPEGIAGVGIDYHLTHGLGLRAGYRGQFFKYPDYGSGGTRLKTFSSQPSLSVTYTFGKRPR
jgi:opacity protein-like surface antigen